jgi:hypothetical protein
MRRSNLAAGALLTLGLAQIAGDLINVRPLKALAAATGASPAPKVFCSANGLETFSTRYHLEWTTPRGDTRSVLLTPELYSRLAGPYNRRNAYGAALAYGPVLATDERAAPMLRAVLDYALAGDAPLLREIGIDASDRAGPVRVRYEPRDGVQPVGVPMILEASR